MDNIKISGIKTYAYHGALDAERILGQFFITDVTMYLDLKDASVNDDLEATVHYGEAYELIEEIIKGDPVSLIEHLAEKVSQSLFDQYGKIQEVEVTITKPSPPIDGHYDNVSITLNRKRES
ncbi:dihydroneopterin aldolase [Lacicoccus qingdaonensis]|uniref:7,8-dihydroneopterin aldolase n=1 Tax=Lacicoccus qingdaonensis TaxID=576118 RepID=A0A1G9GHI5_9BACL|nr:dihydroneopterin aldolase [Salinicoccus qingdaonensis]SDL00159.1 dihydroneopterin aldolase [Salinicoccus qingdaonensis]